VSHAPISVECSFSMTLVVGLAERVAVTTVQEEAAAVLAVKSQVKGATWLRHAARARGMPIYALKVGRCRLMVSKPVVKAPMVSALETRIT